MILVGWHALIRADFEIRPVELHYEDLGDSWVVKNERWYYGHLSTCMSVKVAKVTLVQHPVQ